MEEYLLPGAFLDQLKIKAKIITYSAMPPTNGKEISVTKKRKFRICELEDSRASPTN